MPEMDGFTLTRNIKQDDRFKGLPVIIHSSLSGTTNEDHVRSVGLTLYVAKFVGRRVGCNDSRGGCKLAGHESILKTKTPLVSKAFFLFS